MSPERVILHVDMDAFYASIEQRDHPELKGKPIVVGGPSERGVVAAASYEARTYGVRSAMSTREALRRCSDLVIISPRPQVYQSVSQKIFEIFHRYTPDVEGLSLDEAFLDLTFCKKLWPDPMIVAQAIKQTILLETSLTASIGVAGNKLLAKLASDWLKPNGLFVIKKEDARTLLAPLPIERLYGIGPKTAPLLKAKGILTFNDLANARAAELRSVLGANAEVMIARARGIDDRTVESMRDAKQVSSEKTFGTDLQQHRDIKSELLNLVDQVSHRLRQESCYGRRVILKIRRSDFKTFTRSKTFDRATNDRAALASAALALWEGFNDEHPGTSIRLLGCGVGELETVVQEDLFQVTPKVADFAPQHTQPPSHLTGALDEIQKRFGKSALLRASSLKHPKR